MVTGPMRRQAEIEYTPDFERIEALPWRDLNAEDARDMAAALGPSLTRPGSGAELRPWVAQVIGELLELMDYETEDGERPAIGALCGLPVGQGKTLLFEQAPLALGAKRPVIIMPANLRDKTYAERAEYAKAGFKLARPPARIITTRELCLEANDTLLEDINPDFLGIDECDELANVDASLTKRVDRFVTDHWDTCRVVCATGTLGRKSLLDYWHFAVWGLKDLCPFPLDYEEVKLWASVVDEQTRGNFGTKTRKSPDPGVLGPTVASARKWVRDRMHATPGCIIIDEDSAGDTPLDIKVVLAYECKETDAVFKKLIKRGLNPGDIPITDPLSEYRLDDQCGSGFYQYWDPLPPEEWRVAYRAFAKFVRHVIQRSATTSKPLDTEKQVIRKYFDRQVVQEWLDIKPTFTPNVCAEWFSSAALESCADWLEDLPGDEPGVVWVGAVEFGEALAKMTGLPYYAAKGQDAATGRFLHAADKSRSMVCSWHANKKGFNLQPWRHALIAQMPPSAKWLEQTIGRHHRSGADERGVHFSILATSGGTLDKFEKVLKEAGFGHATIGMTQKILRASITRATPRTTDTSANRYRWARGEDRFDPAVYGL